MPTLYANRTLADFNKLVVLEEAKDLVEAVDGRIGILFNDDPQYEVVRDEFAKLDVNKLRQLYRFQDIDAAQLEPDPIVQGAG